MQDSGSLPASFLRPLLGPLHVLHLVVQHVHEDLLHFLNGLHHLSDALQKALLHGKFDPTGRSLLFLVTLFPLPCV